MRLPILLALLCLVVGCRNKDVPIPDTALVYEDVEVDSGRYATDDSGDLTEEPDSDGDGYPDSEDCEDDDPQSYPGADEYCDGVDNDCDGDTDEDALDASTWYADGDSDGYGDDDQAAVECDQPDGYSEYGGDCDDADPAYNPGATEDDCADPNDYNCDGSVGYDDADGDGYAACEECDDSDAAVNPGADEVCDDVDNDCDGDRDEADALDATTWYADDDGDTYGDVDSAQTACEQPDGYVENDEDCDDGAAESYPGADETCDDADNDCDAVIDEEALDATTWYADDDGDGYGADDVYSTSCEIIEGYTDDAGDCDDADSTINPGADEVCDDADNDCDGDTDEADALDATTWYFDYDGDGWGSDTLTEVSCDQPSLYAAEDGDCDDGDAEINPDAEELCDGVDNDCDGDTDEDGAADPTTYYADADGDGFGDADSTTEACDAPDGYTDDTSDCDDGDAGVNPDAEEVCDGIDNDCDGDVDGGSTDASTWYVDVDGDGYGVEGYTVESCDEPSGYASLAGDCDDGDTAYNPGVTEDDCTDPNDYNCDGVTGYSDSDGDGYAACEECDDGDAGVNPDAEEVCDGIDNDCDGDADEADAVDASEWYADADSDGYGDPDSTQTACDRPDGYLSDSSDCDDTDADILPGGVEICDGVDNDCDGELDEDATDALNWYLDGDADGYGGADELESACTQPSGYVSSDTDCDDSDAAINPGAEELCDGIDNDCDGDTDEDSDDVLTWYDDDDGDGYGDPDDTITACEQPEGRVSEAGDCDDTDADINPDGLEICDGVDNDCDGATDDASALDAETWYADADGDGFGDADSTTESCDAPDGYTGDTSDCDDGDAGVNPDAEEVCDGIDNDCDGDVDGDATDASTWYIDADGDGYGLESDIYAVDSCDEPAGYAALSGDCDDGDTAYNPGATEDDCADPNDYNCDGSVAYADDDGDGYAACEECDDGDAGVNPDAEEVCDGVDNDCDGDADEADAVDASEWYADADSDGYGDPDSTQTACDRPDGYLSDSSDCDDTDADILPGGVEICDEIDQDCDEDVDEEASDAPTWYFDYDEDGYGNDDLTITKCDQFSFYVSDGGDCDDGDDAVNPDAEEICDGIDNDCDGDVDPDDAADAATWYADDDGDGFGDADEPESACAQPDGAVSDSADCDDASADVNPDASEVCNGVDDDCDGDLDEEAVDALVFYGDDDGDGYGDADVTEESCALPDGYTTDDSDCDDGDAEVNPGAEEVCNGLDDDCDGDADSDAVDAQDWYLDLDEDGYGLAAVVETACDQPSGYVTDDSDCNDASASAYPGATEYCNDLDDDCDDTVDEDPQGDATWYVDGDGDGYGDASDSQESCSQPDGYVSNDLDCDDSSGGVYPGAPEYCDEIDNDCNDVVDDDYAVDAYLWYIDYDGDGFGSTSYSRYACEQPSGYLSDDSDCDDAAASAYPGGTEICDGIDNDCDGATDDDDDGLTDPSTWYMDADGDGYGDADASTERCEQPSGYVENDEDCDDDSADNAPDMDEYCDGDDNDCDGDVDEADAVDVEVWYADSDGDGYGDPDETAEGCDAPTDYTDDASDCDDADADVNPDGTESCNGLDDDCDGEWDSEDVCPCYVVNYDDHAYMFCTTVSTWEDAQDFCYDYDYHMLTIDDVAENTIMDSYADTYSTDKWWMGLNDRDSEGTWVWEDGTALDYVNWHSGEPNDYGSGEDCGQFNRWEDNSWNDEPCSSTFNFICEAN